MDAFKSDAIYFIKCLMLQIRLLEVGIPHILKKLHRNDVHGEEMSWNIKAPPIESAGNENLLVGGFPTKWCDHSCSLVSILEGENSGSHPGLKSIGYVEIMNCLQSVLQIESLRNTSSPQVIRKIIFSHLVSLNRGFQQQEKIYRDLLNKTMPLAVSLRSFRHMGHQSALENFVNYWYWSITRDCGWGRSNEFYWWSVHL